VNEYELIRKQRREEQIQNKNDAAIRKILTGNRFEGVDKIVASIKERYRYEQI